MSLFGSVSKFTVNFSLLLRGRVKLKAYTTKIQAGMGLIPETEKPLQLWEHGLNIRDLLDRALEVSDFPTMTARRLRKGFL